MNEYLEQLDLFKMKSDERLVFSSRFSNVLKSQPCMMGIDEAGRGPVLGPMVYACSVTPIDNESVLKEIGLADSKVLTEEQRERMFVRMNETDDLIPYVIDILSPHYITTKMLAKYKTNLNTISHTSAIELIRAVMKKGVNLKEVYVDTVGAADKYQAILQSYFPSLNITVESKADATYPIVSAASVCAKVTRDRVITNWKYKENINLDDTVRGSGYPSDPKTKDFMRMSLDKIFGFPQIVRASWSTAYKIMEKECVHVVWEDDDEEESKGKKRKDDARNSSLLQFYSVSDNNGKKRNQFFLDRNLERVSALH